MKIELVQGNTPPYVRFVIKAETKEESILLRNFYTASQDRGICIGGATYASDVLGMYGEASITNINFGLQDTRPHAAKE